MGQHTPFLFVDDYGSDTPFFFFATAHAVSDLFFSFTKSYKLILCEYSKSFKYYDLFVKKFHILR